MTDTTIIIPVGPSHEDLAHRAKKSAEAQTEHSDVVLVWDDDGKGAGWARNQGLARCKTRLVLFLDADDWLEPNAVEMMAKAWRQRPDYYVYSDWWGGRGVVNAPDCAWCLPHPQGHLVTALMPTKWARGIGGFDEDLPANEDMDFFLKLRHVGKREGRRVATPLVHYSPDGLRSRQIVSQVTRHGPQFTKLGKQLRGDIHARYEGVAPMGCCTKQATVKDNPIGKRQNGDVLAMALWSGNRKVVGHVTGRVYHSGNRRRTWVDRRDVKAAPHEWRIVKRG